MIRSITNRDFDFIYDLYMHPQVNPFLLYEWMAPGEFNETFLELLDKRIIYVFEKDGLPAGMFKLIPLGQRNSHVAYLGGLAIHPSFNGKGLGTAMMKEIMAFARETGFLRIELSVAVENVKAIRLYEKNGFVKEGVLRKYTYLKKEGRFVDEVLMAWIDESLT
jgi:RimJ/RimL family protein N-acetyltransferase